MAFVAECAFCRLTLQGVPDHRLGSTVECPRCRNNFTLAPVVRPVIVATRGPRIVRPRPPAAMPPADIETPPLSPRPSEEKRPARPTHAGERVAPAGPVTARPPKETIPEAATAGMVRRPTAPRRPVDVRGLASFLLGSFAFLAAALFHVGLLTLALGLAGLLFGLLGLRAASARKRRSVLSAVGLAVCLPAVLLPALLPGWLGLGPLWGSPSPPERKGQVALSLNGGRGDFRPAAEAESPWVDAGKDALHLGDARLRVLSAVVGVPSFEPIRGKQPPAVRCLMIRLRITNAGITRNLPYTGWGDDASPEDRPVLHDDRGKSYAVKTFAGWVVKGRAMSSSIPPTKSLEDVVLFEAPPRTVNYLRLELPASAVGADGRLRMEIPKSKLFFR